MPIGPVAATQAGGAAMESSRVPVRSSDATRGRWYPRVPNPAHHHDAWTGLRTYEEVFATADGGACKPSPQGRCQPSGQGGLWGLSSAGQPSSRIDERAWNDSSGPSGLAGAKVGKGKQVGAGAQVVQEEVGEGVWLEADGR